MTEMMIETMFHERKVEFEQSNKEVKLAKVLEIRLTSRDKIQ